MSAPVNVAVHHHILRVSFPQDFDGKPALRVSDLGMPPPCCPKPWVASKGSGTVFINGLPAHRLGDEDLHAAGPGRLIEGSPDVNIGG